VNYAAGVVQNNGLFIFDDGEEIPIPKDKVKQVLRTETGREAKKNASEQINKMSYGGGLEAFKGSFDESLFGNMGETGINYLTSAFSGLSKGKGQEELGYIDRVLDSFYAKQEARKEHLDKLRKESPIASGFGSALGTVGELGLLHGLPAKYAIPAMGLGSSETSFLEPGEKSKEVVKEGIEGAILDKFFGGLAKVAACAEVSTFSAINSSIPNILSETGLFPRVFPTLSEVFSPNS